MVRSMYAILEIHRFAWSNRLSEDLEEAGLHVQPPVGLDEQKIVHE